MIARVPVTMRKSTATCLLVALASVFLAGHTRAQGEDVEPAAEIATDAVRLDGYTLLSVAGISSLPATERAAAISGRIKGIADDPGVAVDTIAVVPVAQGLEIRAPGRPIMVVSSADARREGVPLELLAELNKIRITEAIIRYRSERTPAQLRRSATVGLAATGTLLAALWLAVVLFRRLDGWLARRYEALVQSRSSKLVDALRIAPLMNAMRRSVVTARIIVFALLIFIWLEFVLGQFPWTRWLSENMAGLLLDPLATIFVGIANYIPNLLFLVVLVLVARFGLRMMRLYFGALDRGSLRLPGFEPEWALASYKIVRVVLVGVVFVMAYPYLPGSGSEALKGLSVFAGLMLSLGASSSVSNVIAGYVTTFGRVLRMGDVIKVGDVLGAVTQVRLLTIRLRTVRNEEVTIPNSVILGSNVTNYSALAREHGLVLQPEVGIGYEVPWRQVHAMLLEAAARTPGLMTDRAAFVLQRQLGDFAVVYQLNVYKPEATGFLQTYSVLYQNILDVFNEYGVQIMTPAYVADPEIPKMVPPGQWFPPPAKAPDPVGNP